MKSFMKKIKSANGVTLIVLVITVLVLIILAIIAVNISIGNNGIVRKSKASKFGVY